VRKLAHEAIECRVLDGMDADQALLAEIDENLVRADLTPSERGAHHAKRKQLYLKLHRETEKGKAGGRPRKTSDKMSKVSTSGYAKAAAKKVGKTSRTVARDVSRGEKMRPASVIASCTASVPVALDSRSTRRRWQRAGQDEKMLSAEPKDRPKERTQCSETRYPDPKTSPLHETGASRKL
jgi:hypothetical protein